MQEKQAATTTSNKAIGIDSVLPISQPPFTELRANVVIADEAAGGLDGGCKEKPTNMQEGVTKGGSISHVLHEEIHFNHRPDFRAPATTTPM
ncbi:hypothetical protein H5410_027321 [Solanum commersonii]|uniref:Uncharacterized protein n=1 Tax=Solanum commersonii TaxID=4109 RepID=A0A9J5Z0Z0_SOLCO|nr:hypothetical protein H5410_027321 [Solanum commersonii]